MIFNVLPGTFAFALQDQVTPSLPSSRAMASVRGALSVNVSSSKKNSFTWGKAHRLTEHAHSLIPDGALNQIFYRTLKSVTMRVSSRGSGGRPRYPKKAKIVTRIR